MELAEIIVYGLAVYRVSHLIVIDHWVSKTRKKVVFGIRDLYEANSKNKFRRFFFSKLFSILTCVFCVSVWLSVVWFFRSYFYVDAAVKFFAVAAIPCFIGDISNGKYVQVLQIDQKEAQRQDADI